MQKGSARRVRWRLLMWGTLSLIVFSIFLSALVSVLYVEASYQTEIAQELYNTDIVVRSPRFFAYRFSDRANRVGESYEVSNEIYAQKSATYVPYHEIPKALVNAFVAIEDKRFFEHEGVDWYRTVAAGVNYLFGFSERFGASTITQQLVKNMTGADEISMGRKLQEILYAMDLERRLDKTEIMELYLNVIHFSDHCDGIAAAAEHYFSKTPADLTVAECATIAAITNNPSYYNPIRHPENNLVRRDLILSEMHAQGYLSDTEYEEAVATALNLKVDELEGDGVNSWYADMVIEDVIQDLMVQYGMSRSAASRLFYTGGLRVDIAMDAQIQKIVEDYYLQEVQMPQNADGEHAQSALIVMDSRTGDILGVAGAVGEKRGNHLQNFATQTLRPPGSTIKPLSVYAPALEKGIINWASVYDDVPTEFGVGTRLAWPKNATGVYRGLTNVAYAVAHSTNTVAVRVLEDVGLRSAFRFARDRFHLSHLIDERERSDCAVAALALGQTYYGVTVRELTTAYTAFADAGMYHASRSYYRVLDANGNVLLSRPDTSEAVLSAENAALMTKLLEGVVEHGTSSAVTLGELCECAGKTGTTNKDCDRWFVGYTPDLVCGVWCGYEYPEPMVGKNLATDIWNDVMRSIVAQAGGRRRFEVPTSLVRVSYCKDSGMLLSDACRQDVRGDRSETGWFVKGSEPKTFCNCHVLCDYDMENGGISHGYCPSESVKKVGLIRVERHFPVQIYVSDAEYVYRSDPAALLPNENAEQAYFAQDLKDYAGVSGKKTQFNRSCTTHTREAYEKEALPDPDGIAVPWNFDVEDEE